MSKYQCDQRAYKELLMNEQERRDLAELWEYYHDTEKAINRIRHLCKFSHDRMNELKDKPEELACTSAMYAAFHLCLEILRDYADNEEE